MSDSKPSTSAPSAIVKLQNPRLLLTCEGDNIAAYCPERTVTSFCDSSGTEKCEFLDIPYDVVSWNLIWWDFFGSVQLGAVHKLCNAFFAIFDHPSNHLY